MQADAAKALVVAMRSDGLEPDIYTYGPLVTALGRAGLVDEAFQVPRCRSACSLLRLPACLPCAESAAGCVPRPP